MTSAVTTKPELPGPDQRRREVVESLVERTLGPASGLCLRVFDPLGDDPQGRDRARMIAMECIARCAARGATSDDRGVREVIRTVAVAGLDALVGHPGGARPPAGVSLGAIEDDSEIAADVAPSGMLRYAVLQDASAPARRRDREVAFVVLAAGVAPADAAVLLGVTEDAVESSLARVVRRIAQGEGIDSVGDRS